MRPALAALLLAATGGTAAQPVPDPAVLALLQSVAQSGCMMERNGELHAAGPAADHLRMKLERSGQVSMSPDEFIDRIASGSSLSGVPYRVHCPGQPAVDSRAWLRTKLATIAARR